jgi:hypothetical protein
MKKTLLIAALLLIGIGFFSYQKGIKKAPIKKMSQQKLPLLASRTSVSSETIKTKRKSAAAPGKQRYTISQNHHSPNFTQAIIDPEDVRVGQKQTMTVTLGDEKAPITEVIAEIQTDIGIIKNPLKLISGTNQNGVWEGSWIVRDTHDTMYVTTFKAVNALGEKGEARLSWTDPGCSDDATVGHGTAVTITANCTITGVDGADGGLFTITSGTVTVSAGAVLSTNDLLITGGTLVKNNDSGVVSVVSGSVICMTDGDADGYPLDTAQYADGSACSGGRRRRNLMTKISTIDCNDAVYSVGNSCGNCWAISNVCDSGCTYSVASVFCGSSFPAGSVCNGSGTGNCYKAAGASALIGCDDSIGWPGYGYCFTNFGGCIYLPTTVTCTWKP